MSLLAINFIRENRIKSKLQALEGGGLFNYYTVKYKLLANVIGCNQPTRLDDTRGRFINSDTAGQWCKSWAMLFGTDWAVLISRPPK